MSDIAPSQFHIDSTMEYVSDQFDLDLPGSALSRAASTSDRVTLRAGLLDGSNTQQLITAMTNAVIDEYELRINQVSITEHIRGRDAGSVLLERTYKQTYRRSPVTAPITQVPPPLGTPVVPVQTGRFNASKIASDAVASVGLGLSWGCRDYQLLTDFAANGRVIDILRTLTQPWNLVSPFKIDIYVVGTTVVISQRTFPLNRIDFSSNLASAKETQLTVRKRPTTAFGLVTLRGQKIANTNIDPNGTPIVTRKNFSVTYETQPDNPTSRSAYDVRYRLPDNVLEYEQKSSYANSDEGNMVLVSRETTNNDWTSTQYDAQGRPLKSAQQSSSFTTIERVDPSDDAQLLRVWETNNTTYAHDGDGFVVATTTIKQTLDLDTGNMLNSEMTLKDIVNTAPLLNDSATTLYKWEEDFNGNFTWVFQRRDVTPTGGHKPGGPGRGQPTSITVPNPTTPSPSQGGSTQIILTHQFLSNGLDFSYSNENLTMSDLQFIMGLFAAADAVWEYEVEFFGVAKTWLQRGSTIQFTNIVLEDGVTTFPVPVLLITEIQSTYDESKLAASALYKGRAFGYATT